MKPETVCRLLQFILWYLCETGDVKTSFSQISLYCCFSTWIGLSVACTVQFSSRKGLRRVNESYCSLGAFAHSTEIPAALFLKYFILNPYFPGCLGLILGSLFSLFPPQDLSLCPFLDISAWFCLPSCSLVQLLNQLCTQFWKTKCLADPIFAPGSGTGEHQVMPAVLSFHIPGTWDGRSRAREQMFWASGYHTVLSSVLGIAWHPWHSWEVLVQILKICVRERMTKSTTAERLVRAGLKLWMEAHECVPPAALHVSVQAGALWQHSPICCSVPVAGRPAGVVYECCSTVWIGKSNTDLGRMRLERWAAAVPAHSKEQRCLWMQNPSVWRVCSAGWKEKLELFVRWSQRKNAHIRKMHSHLCFSFVPEKDQWKQRCLFHKA